MKERGGKWISECTKYSLRMDKKEVREARHSESHFRNWRREEGPLAGLRAVLRTDKRSCLASS